MGSPIEELQKRDELRIFALAIMDRLKMDDYYKATTIAEACYGEVSLEQVKRGFEDEKLQSLYQAQPTMSTKKKDNQKVIQSMEQNGFVQNKPIEVSFQKNSTLRDISGGLKALGDTKQSIAEIVKFYTTATEEITEKKRMI